MSGYLIDSNVLLDIATSDATWMAWSKAQLISATQVAPLFVNPIIYAEISPAFNSSSDVDQWLDPSVFQRAALPFSAAWRASQAFLKYRSAGGARTSPLPDFYIGAHAEVESLHAHHPRCRPIPDLFPKR